MAKYYYIFGKGAIEEYDEAETIEEVDAELVALNGTLYEYDERINSPDNILDAFGGYEDYIRISEENFLIIKNQIGNDNH